MILIKTILSISKDINFKYEKDLNNTHFIQIPFIALSYEIVKTKDYDKVQKIIK